jgi:signal-transduction protein with cAMP-binding, CBS, and nucleotidyltransferase domain
MDALNLDIMVVIDDNRFLQGIIERDKLISRMILKTLILK